MDIFSILHSLRPAYIQHRDVKALHFDNESVDYFNIIYKHPVSRPSLQIRVTVQQRKSVSSTFVHFCIQMCIVILLMLRHFLF